MGSLTGESYIEAELTLSLAQAGLTGEVLG